MPLLTLEENHLRTYATRTEENIRMSDCTLAFVVNLKTEGMRATSLITKKKNKPLFIVDLKTDLEAENIDETVTKIADVIMEKCFSPMFKGVVINIAGNGIYELKNSNITQGDVDLAVLKLIGRLKKTLEERGYPILRIRSGGQTGADEAGIRTGIRLGIKTTGLFPRGYKIRDVNGVDREYTSIQTRKRFEQE